MFARSSAISIVGVLLMFGAASAQSNWHRSPDFAVGIDFIVAEPVGEFANSVDAGYGADLMGRFSLDRDGYLSLRADLGFVIYGYESKRVCFEGVGCRVNARLQTTNNIFFGGLGPELALPLGWGRPYVHAFMGFGYFNTMSNLESIWGDEDHFNTQNMGDGTLSWGAGWGMEINVSRGRVPISLDFGARYHKNGVMEYLTEGGIIDNPDGSITLHSQLSEANFVSYRFGISVGMPQKRDKDRGRRSKPRRRR